MAPPSPNTTLTFKVHKSQKLTRFRAHQTSRLERHGVANNKYLTGALKPTTIPSNSHDTKSPPLNYGSSVRTISDTSFTRHVRISIWDNTTVPSSLIPILEGDAFDKGKGNRNYLPPYPSCILTNDDLSEAYKHMHAPHISRLSTVKVVKCTRDSASEKPADPTPLPSRSRSPQPLYTTKALYAGSSTDRLFAPSSSPSSPAAFSPASGVRAPSPEPPSLATPPPSPTSPFFPRSSLTLRHHGRYSSDCVCTGLNAQLPQFPR
ncbi:hypothetical protein DV737_g5003, partial [Chaetothyriales sp. CBS 132003]